MNVKEKKLSEHIDSVLKTINKRIQVLEENRDTLISHGNSAEVIEGWMVDLKLADRMIRLLGNKP